MSVRERLDALADRIDQRLLRERVLLFGAAALVVVLLWDVAVRAPIAARAANAEERIESLEARLTALRSSRAQMRATREELASRGPATVVAQTREQLEEVDDALAERTMRVVSPAEMVRVLRDMLQADDRLTLDALRNEDAEPIISERRTDQGARASSSAGEDAERAASMPRVYRHRVEVVARGEYFALLAYLQRLQGLDWQFQWDALHVEVVDYPTARARISLSTLSLAEGWIGV